MCSPNSTIHFLPSLWRTTDDKSVAYDKFKQTFSLLLRFKDSSIFMILLVFVKILNLASSFTMNASKRTASACTVAVSWTVLQIFSTWCIHSTHKLRSTFLPLKTFSVIKKKRETYEIDYCIFCKPTLLKANWMVLSALF